jgi:hypothetical protein
LSGWGFAAICFGLYVLLTLFNARSNQRQVAVLAASRASPGREEFIKLLRGDCDRDVAEFAWKIFAEEYSDWGVELTPHPDDNYLRDMPIDPENQSDWFNDFCDDFALSYRDFPDWPEGEATTVRNFARWLSDGSRSLGRAAA